MNYRKIPFMGGTPPGVMHQLEGLPMSKIARIPVSNLPPGVPGLVRWIKTAHPSIYRAIGQRLAAKRVRLQGLGLAMPGDDLSEVKVNVQKVADSASPGSSVANTILSTVKDLVTVGLPLYQQQKLFDLQLSRAKQGLAPLDTSAIADASAFRVGVDSATRNTGLWIVGGLAAAFLGYKLLTR